MIALGVRELRRRIGEQAERLFEPPPDLSTAEWADAERMLSADAGAVEPGQWTTDRVPYLREVMESLDDPTCTRVIFMKSSQVGGSECGLNWLGKTIDIDPTPFITLFPSEDSLKNYSTTMLEPMLRDTPSLRGRVIDGDLRRDRRNTMTRKMFAGGFWMGLTGRSSAQLRSLRAPRAIAEEIDELEAEIKHQGDPMDLLARAQRAFLRLGMAKTFEVSTPTDEEVSRIARAYDASDRRRYYWPCPQCNHEQPLIWRDELDDGDGQYRFIYEKEAGERHVVPGSVRYICRACEAQLPESWRDAVYAEPGASRWVAEAPQIRDPRGFHIWTAYSPFVTWDSLVQKFLDSFEIPTKLKTFVNLWLGKTYRSHGDTVKAGALQSRVEPYGDGVDVPHGVGLVTAAIDVHADRLEYILWGFGAGEESWLIEWNRVEGDPGNDATFDECGAACFRTLQHASGAQLRAAVVAIDAKYQTTHVWKFVRRWRAKGFRVLPTMGKEGRGRPLMQRPDPKKVKKSHQQERPTYIMGSDEAKTLLLLNRAHIKERGPGFMHFPDSTHPTFFDQFTGEELTTVYVNKMPVRRWLPIRNRQNHALDLSCMALCALHDFGPLMLNQLGKLASKWSATKGALPPPSSGGAPRKGGGLVSEHTW